MADFKNFTPQQIAYLDLHKAHNDIETLIEKLSVMEMPCSVMDEMNSAIMHISTAKFIMQSIMNGDGDPYTE